MNCRSAIRFSLVCLAIIQVQSLSPGNSPASEVATTKTPAGDFAGAVRLALPPVIYAVPGVEANVYFDNVVLVLNAANFAFDVQCPKGRQQQGRWTFSPGETDIGDHPFELEVRNDRNEIVARGHSSVRVTAASAGQGREVAALMIGDSLTHASVYPKRWQTLCDTPAGPKMTLIGSHGPGGVPGTIRHEGYGGWTAQRFATHAVGVPRQGDYAKRASPFLYPGSDGKPTLDLTAYCRDVSEGRLPDIVTIFLGPNDIFSATDASIESVIDTMLGHYDSLVQMVQTAAPKARIGVMLPVPPAASQDAFGANYANGQTRWQYKRNQHRLVERMLERYGGRETEGILIVPTHVNLDCQHNYPAESAPINAASEIKVLRQNNGVHPAPAGYDQIGDVLYAWLKGLL
ncbi:MAG: SGNH/GDSL hydrolase family protein [Planctomycetales bacterium]